MSEEENQSFEIKSAMKEENSTDIIGDFSESETKTMKEQQEQEKEKNRVHREATLNFSELSSDLTVGEVQDEANAVENENITTESPLDKYIREHREEVEEVRAGFGKDIDELVKKEREVITGTVSDLPVEEDSEEESKSEEKMTGLAAVGLVNTELTDGSTEVLKGNEDTKDNGNIENNEEVENDEGSEEIKDNEIENEESDPSEAYESDVNSKSGESLASFTEKVETIEGELLDKTVHRVVFPLPLAADAFEKENEKKEPENSDSEGESDIVSDTVDKFDTVVIAPVDVSVELPNQEKIITSNSIFDSVDSQNVENDSEAQSIKEGTKSEEKRSHKKPIVIGVAVVALLAAGGGGFAVYEGNQQHQARVAKINKQQTEAVNTFKKSYNEFFVDNKHTALKNVNFDMLTSLDKNLNSISENTGDYKHYQSEYKNLSNDIFAIQKINAIFDKPVIVDGKFDETVKVKSNASVPAVSSKNPTLNNLLKQAVSLADSQLKAETASEQSSSSTAAPAPNNNNSTTNQGSTSTATSGVYSQNPSGKAPNSSNSRVPVQNVNPNDPAFSWTAGVLNTVLSTCQARGYISGSNYILEPVAIGTSGDGWYNLYRPDGTYLVSINCKTGYFVGNGAGHASAVPDTF